MLGCAVVSFLRSVFGRLLVVAWKAERIEGEDR